MDSVSIRAEPFDPNREVDLLRGSDPSTGAVVTFIGLMRDINEGDRVERLYLEHYPGMTERALQEIVDEANSRWDIQDCRVVHRVGTLLPTDPIVLVAVASRHRKEAFRACEFIIDYLKTKAPFWKKETTAEGERWVDARESDDTATLAWEKSDA
ncbi:MAG: molybdenum cofactor biosynthesis protein MoaE [gamma proteobacterium symbiont of Ctena orbiculata]|uniref:Molybdopterin synthase catalytic subunit n=1 Tax=Candidatus Thiodiazotropha taylori TaxID=2792791 RepID=A0A944M7A6_9GAMM|nr:molybdopterin synthase catalytic subunit MoaE [Candidatus Thiodiazotropha taylori]PUB82642.1 MAG: molybdopterin synthase catalytic subunit MoaE [gamma proteobacterium symbiont of Ctena orbiculata]MBV2137731.1 molybdopterin synthase catalytic subunit MoaE [Candidatus Thiodiazotropha taylori]PVV09962.1 MAG: molybdenum cofactor biosynthesis protein MoaE [gamma proteobacterium symbiont of Ctena orbiculata]PVV13627.1 MAG: molybdenum cofactor biosynthesis protein MoaE [gamma proteobacterium symbio